jgi:hypothetical protein
MINSAMNDQNQHRLTKEQKVGFVLLLIFGLMTIGMGFLQMRNTLYGPYTVHTVQNDLQDIGDLFSEEDIRLQAVDTDRDGISDYEEIYYYNTSAYLPDTDSDGISDKEEIERGDDPLCPQGESCDSGVGEADQDGEFQFAGAPEEEPLPPADAALTSPEALEALLNDPEAIRDLLSRTGQFTPEQLESIDDDTLINLVKELTGDAAPGSTDEQLGEGESQTQTDDLTESDVESGE